MSNGAEGKEYFCDICEDRPGECKPEYCPGNFISGEEDPTVETTLFGKPGHGRTYPGTPPPSLEADWQEARSIRYAAGVRLVLLSSGHWALFYGGEQGHAVTEIWESLDLERLAQVLEDERRLRDSEPKPVVAVKQSLEEMGL